MQTQIQTCIQDVTLIAAALATAKRRPPREVPSALDRLLATLSVLALQAGAEPARVEAAAKPTRTLEYPPPANDPPPAVDPEIAALQAQVAATLAKLARSEKPAPTTAPAARAAAAPTKATGKRREPPLPSIPQVVVMLERVIKLKEGATIGKGKNTRPAALTDLAKLWLTEERSYRAALRRQGRMDELAERTPEKLCAPQPGQDPEQIGKPWEHEEEWLESDSSQVVNMRGRTDCPKCGRENGQVHKVRCHKE
jgi:hypothetical protein